MKASLDLSAAAIHSAGRRRTTGAAAFLSALIVLVSSVPYLCGSALADDSHVFVGLSPFRSDDANVYLSYLTQSRDGAWTLEDRYNSLPMMKGRVDVFFLALGRLARLSGISVQSVYRISRIIFGWLLLMTIYWVMAARSNSTIGLAAVIIAGASSGVGWLWRLIADNPESVRALDVLPTGPVVEANTFAALSRSPLHIVSATLMLLYFHFLLEWLDANGTIFFLASCVTGLVLANIHTYDYPLMMLAPLALIVMGKPEARPTRISSILRLTPVALIVSLAPAHLYMVLKENPAWGPVHVKIGGFSIIDLAATYGVLLIVAGIAIVSRSTSLTTGRLGVTNGNEPYGSVPGRNWFSLLCVWAAVGMIVPFIVPYAWSRKTIEGTHLALGLIAAFYLGDLLDGKNTRIKAIVWILLLTPSSLLSISDACAFVRESRNALTAEAPAGYLHRDELIALGWIERHTEKDGVFLASFAIGNFIPGWSGRRVFVGHVGETRPFEEKMTSALRFFEGRMAKEQQRAFLRDGGINYVFFGRREQQIGGYPPKSPHLKLAYQNSTVRIFRVIEN